MATMERPRPSSEEETPAVSSTPAKEESTKEAKPALPSDPEQAVEALEKRLEGLGGPTAPVSDADEAKKPAAAPAPTPAPPAAAKGAPAGKNALLVSSFQLGWFLGQIGYILLLCLLLDYFEADEMRFGWSGADAVG